MINSADDAPVSILHATGFNTMDDRAFSMRQMYSVIAWMSKSRKIRRGFEQMIRTIIGAALGVGSGDEVIMTDTN